MGASNYVQNHIPKNTANNRRPALPMLATTITIHNTGNEKSTAQNERDWLTNPTNNRKASFHIAVDERGVIECLPLNENAWHAGDGSGASSGNRTSIGIEICESGNYTKTLDNAAELVASMLKERGWGVDRLRRHYDWSGKICPRLMYDNGKWTGWTAFKALVEIKLKPVLPPVNKPQEVKKLTNFKDVAAGAWYEKSIKVASDLGIMNGDTQGNFNPAKTLTRAEMATIIAKLHEKGMI